MIENSKVKEYYNTYTTRQKKVGVNERHQSILKQLINAGLTKNSSVLEIGCGIGTLSGLILKHLSINGSLTAYDISDKSIEMAKQSFLKYKNGHFFCADVTQTEIMGMFDVIVLPDVIEHIPTENHQNLFKGLHQNLKESGFMLIHLPHESFQKWLIKNTPEAMQIIDQPISFDSITRTLYDNNFEIIFSKVYSVWVKPFDYQFVIAKSNNKNIQFVSDIKEISFLDKIKYKLKNL